MRLTLSVSRISTGASLSAQSLIAGLLLSAACAPATAQPVADFYRGKTISFLVGSGEGGGFDLSARLNGV